MNMQPIYIEKQKLCITSCRTNGQYEHIGAPGTAPLRVRDGGGKWIALDMRDAILVAAWVIGTHSFFAWHIKEGR